MPHVAHTNADLIVRARGKLPPSVIDQGWTLRRAAERFQCSLATAKKWADPYRVHGEKECRTCPGARVGARTGLMSAPNGGLWRCVLPAAGVLTEPRPTCTWRARHSPGIGCPGRPAWTEAPDCPSASPHHNATDTSNPRPEHVDIE